MTERIPDDHILDDITEVAEKVGHPPSIIEYHDHGLYSQTAIKTRWEGWIEALEAAGLEPRPEQRQSAQVHRA